MPTAVAQRTSGTPSTEHYVPDYIIEVEGVALDPQARGDILDIKVVMDMDNMTSLQLSVNNWDDRTLAFKYSDTATFDIGNRIHVQMGYVDRLVSLMRGQISTLTPHFPAAGPPTIGVSALDGMLKLRDRKPTDKDVKKFENKADWEIAKIIAERNGLKAKVTEEGEVHALVWQKNQDDAAFLMERAKRIDFDVFVRTDPDSGEDTLHFIKPPDKRDGAASKTYVFTWGKNLIDFHPKLTLSNQVAAVTVRGWNPAAKQVISYKATHKDLKGGDKGKGVSGPQAAEQRVGGKQNVTVDAPIATVEEAKKLAVALLQEKAYQFITGSGNVIGLADLRPGDNLELQELGSRFSGDYYIKKVVHTLNSAGYKTAFEVRRVYDGGLK